MVVNVFCLTRSMKQSSMSIHPLNSMKLGCPPSKSSMSVLIVCHPHSLKGIQSLMFQHDGTVPTLCYREHMNTNCADALLSHSEKYQHTYLAKNIRLLVHLSTSI